MDINVHVGSDVKSPSEGGRGHVLGKFEMVPICPAPHLVRMMGAYDHLAQSFLGIGEAKMSKYP